MPILSDLKMISPTGVADFVQVSQGEIAKNLNNSFSWTECPIEVDTPPQRGKAATNLGIAERMQRIEQRLKWLELQSAKDKQDFYDQLRKAKSKARDEIFQKYEPLLKKSDDHYDGQVLETTKIINYLRDDNAKLREEINGLKRNIAKLTQANKELEAANASALASHADLEDHVEGLEAVQHKLNKNCRVLKQALSQMKQDYSKRSAFYHMESKTVSMYEICLAKVLTQVQKSPKSAGSAMQQELYRIAEEGAIEVETGRETQLQKYGRTMDQRQLRQTEMLKNPELLIAAQKRLVARNGDSDSDSDSHSEDDSSSSDSDDDSDDESASGDDSN